MALIVLFFLGIANFAMHKAVLESQHPVLDQIPPTLSRLSGRFSLLVEYVMLVGCMLMVRQGAEAWAWGYLGYSCANALAAWLILSHRV